MKMKYEDRAAKIALKHHYDNVASQDFKLTEVGTSIVLPTPYTQLNTQQELQVSRQVKETYFYCPFSSLN